MCWRRLDDDGFGIARDRAAPARYRRAGQIRVGQRPPGVMRAINAKTCAAVGIVIAAAAGVSLGTWWWLRGTSGHADPNDAAQVALGRSAYAGQCARCHGDLLQGQPNWRERQANGRLPAPPHDETGHTWHHPDRVLFEITRHGLQPPNAPEGYPSDMPAYDRVLSDAEIWAVIAFLKASWPQEIRSRQQRITDRAGN